MAPPISIFGFSNLTGDLSFRAQSTEMIQKSFDRLRQNYPTIAIAIIAVAMPALLSLGYYYVTGDPTFRPLGITIERLAERGEAVGNDVIFGTITYDGTPDGEKEQKHKIVDWEACMLFWNCRRSHGDKWEQPFRAKLEEDLGSKELMFLMGNQHRFQDQWLIVSLIYPPKQKLADDPQMPLL